MDIHIYTRTLFLQAPIHMHAMYHIAHLHRGPFDDHGMTRSEGAQNRFWAAYRTATGSEPPAMLEPFCHAGPECMGCRVASRDS